MTVPISHPHGPNSLGQLIRVDPIDNAVDDTLINASIRGCRVSRTSPGEGNRVQNDWALMELPVRRVGSRAHPLNAVFLARTLAAA